MKYLVFILLFAAVPLSAQVNIQEDFAIQQLMSKYVSSNLNNPYFSGWRIQVAASTDHQKIQSIYADFVTMYPDIPAEWKHESPYYKLRAGAYLTKLEALAALQTLKRHYRTAFPAFDKHIPIKEFLSTN